MKMPNIGDQVVLSDNPNACVYTVSEVYSSKGVLWAKLTYVNDAGRVVNCGSTDASLLMQPNPNHNASLDAIVKSFIAALQAAKFDTLSVRFHDIYLNYIEDCGAPL